MRFLVWGIIIIDLVIIIAGITLYWHDPLKMREHAKESLENINPERADSLWQWRIGSINK